MFVILNNKKSHDRLTPFKQLDLIKLLKPLEFWQGKKINKVKDLNVAKEVRKEKESKRILCNSHGAVIISSCFEF